MRTYHGGYRADDEDNSGHTSCQQSGGASGQTQSDEDVGCIVNDCVDSTAPKLAY